MAFSKYEIYLYFYLVL